LNKPVVNLLCHMLQVDPMKRATIDDIKKHDWFQKELPAYLFPSPVEQDSSVIDTYAVQEVCAKFGVKEQEVHNALLSGDPHDQLAIAYHLIIDNKRIADEAAKAELKDFYVASSPPPVSFSPNEFSPSPVRPHPERIAPTLREKAIVALNKDGMADKNRNLTTPTKRAKWHLGIRSQSKPSDIMNEVYKAMKALNFEWKVVNPYHVRVRHRRTPEMEEYTKMSLQLYQVDYKNYLLDFKSLSTEEDIIPMDADIISFQQSTGGHHTMEFFEMCASLITQLAR